MIKKAILHTDGGSRGNPGPSGIGFVILLDDGKELETLCEGGAFIGDATNNEAEYQAMLWGLANASVLGVQHLSIRADSELLVKQVKGEYKVRSEGILPLYKQVKEGLFDFDSYEIAHVYREDNSRADALANEAMDEKASVGNFRVPCLASPDADDALYEDDEAFEVDAIDEIDVIEEIDEVDDLDEIYDIDDIDEDGPLTLLDEENEPHPSIKNSAAAKSSNASTGYYTLSIKEHFDAAHALVGYPGECQHLHGHTWDIEATVSGTELDEVGIVYDFKALKADLAKILDDYDHKYLNEIPPFDSLNATAENLARIIYERLEESLPANIELVEIGVWESPIAKLTYRKNK